MSNAWDDIGRAWEEIKESAASYFAEMTPRTAQNVFDVTAAGDHEPYVLMIDAVWELTEPQLSVARHQYLSRCNQIEALLEEAGRLAERALADRAIWDQLAAERLKLRLELIEFGLTKEREDQERADAAFWGHAAADARAEKDVNVELLQDKPAVTQALEAAVQSRNSAKASAFPMKGSEGGLAHASASAAVEDATAARIAQLNYLRSLEKRVNLQEARASYAEKAQAFISERQKIALQLAQLKIKEIVSETGAFNYNRRLKALANRTSADFLEAYSRLSAIEQGMRMVYGVELPAVDAYCRPPHMLEGCVAWLRLASNELSRARLDDQQFLYRVTLPTQDDLHAALNRSVAFDIQAADLQGWVHLRLTGVSVSAAGLDEDAWLELELIAPAQTLDNTTLPTVAVRVGPVTSSSSERETRDVAGGRPLANRSPVGRWSIRTVRRHNGARMSALHVDLHLIATRGLNQR